MRKIKFCSATGFPDSTHLQHALELAKEHAPEMSIGAVKKFGASNLQTTLKIQDNNDILLVLVDTNKLED